MTNKSIAEVPAAELTYKLGGTIQINRMGYGAMQLNGPGVWGDFPKRDLAKHILLSVVESGVNFIDTADAYGPHTNEVLVYDSIKNYYDNIVIATKGGFERSGPNQWHVNGSPGHIASSIDGSLKRLGKEQLQLWQLHRVDPAFPIEETLAPVADAVKAGKIKYVGLSEVDIKVIERAQKVIPIVSVQNKYNLSERTWEQVVDYTAANNIAFIPWYPLASGPQKMEGMLAQIAAKHKATISQIALAWLLQRSPNVLLIPGTSSQLHLQENLEAVQIRLEKDDFETLSKITT